MRSRASVLALGAGVALALAAQPFTAEPAHAGGAIGWANAVTQFSTEGEAVGAAAVILGIIAIGAVLFFGLSGLVGTVIMACLGGALMANAQQVASIFGGGGGGGSIHHVVPAPLVPGGVPTPLPGAVPAARMPG
jgi:type IV secretory pathway VirB2 component (pilin)